MDPSTPWGTLLGLGGECAVADDAARVVAVAVPQLLELAGAATCLVVRRDADGLLTGPRAGVDVDAEDLADDGDQLVPGALVDRPVPAAWRARGLARLAARPLIGDAGTLVIGWGEDAPAPGPALDVGLQTVDAALRRLASAAELHDVVTRVDDAQRLAHMGDYDWHIPTDTNRWSDELYRIYGFAPQSFNASYERFLGLVHPDDRERVTAVHRQAYATGEPFAMIERIVRPDGEVRHLSSSGEVLMDRGHPERMRGTCLDVTDRVLAERALERIAARFRALVESAPDAIVVLDDTGLILEVNRRAHDLLGGDPTAHLIEELLPLEATAGGLGIGCTGLDGRSVTLDVTTVNVGRVGDESLVALFLRDAETRLAGEALASRLSEAHLRRRQALEINDNVVQGLAAAAYALENEQEGVAASYVERTLASARAMMDDLLGPLDGEDLAPGELVRRTPAVIGPADDDTTSPGGAPAAGAAHRVLVVDDAEDLRLLLRTRMGRLDGVVVVGEAADGLAAIEAARELQPDLVLLDLAMPRMDGLEALPLILEAVPGVRVIVFSGFNQDTLAQQALNAGADRYVVKGGPMRDLIETVQSLLLPS